MRLLLTQYITLSDSNRLTVFENNMYILKYVYTKLFYFVIIMLRYVFVRELHYTSK